MSVPCSINLKSAPLLLRGIEAAIREGETPMPRMISRRWRRDWSLGVIAVSVIVLMTATACGVARSGPSVATGLDRSQKATSSQATFIYAQSNSWGSTFSYNVFNPSYWAYLNGVALLPLGYAAPGRFASRYVPELASSWRMTKTKVMIDLRTDARWQDGKPLTSRDLSTTLLLEGVDHNQIWNQISGFQAVGAHRVILDVRRGVSPDLVLNSALGLYVIPSSEYATFVVPGLERDLLQTYSAPTDTQSGAAKTVSSVLARLVKFAPKTFVGDGPFELVKVTSEAGTLHRWRGFWASSKIKVGTWEFLSFSDATNVFPALFSHRVDMSLTFPTDLIEQRLVHTPGLVYLQVPAYYQWGVYFNSRKYPLNLTGVRQAISYLVRRKRLDALAYGYHTENQIADHPDGLIQSVAAQWLSQRQVASLNTYSYNPSKAASILRQLGFHKKGQWWYLPDGKQFTLTADGPSGWTQTVTEMQVVASSLTNFGIKTSASAVEQPGYWTYQDEGNFDLDWGWETYGTNDPLLGIAGVLSSYDFVSKTEPGIGFGPTADVPGLGSVNVPETISKEASTVGPGGEMRKLTWDWARLMNQQVPVLTLANKYSTFEYTTSSFTNWPPKRSQLWGIIGNGNTFGGIALAMERGYIRPKP